MSDSLRTRPTGKQQFRPHPGPLPQGEGVGLREVRVDEGEGGGGWGGDLVMIEDDDVHAVCSQPGYRIH